MKPRTSKYKDDKFTKNKKRSSIDHRKKLSNDQKIKDLNEIFPTWPSRLIAITDRTYDR